MNLKSTVKVDKNNVQGNVDKPSVISKVINAISAFHIHIISTQTKKWTHSLSGLTSGGKLPCKNDEISCCEKNLLKR